ncbi:MAG: DUF2437 domain-containing protein, partial [Bryobacterales bacterium]|nr:DUF2437 domain-containing protein [Bryobacterales bacterium]
MTRRAAVFLPAAAALAAPRAGVTRYVRFRKGNVVASGILEGETIRELQGDPFGSLAPTGAMHSLGEVKMLYPCRPTKVLAVALGADEVPELLT